MISVATLRAVALGLLLSLVGGALFQRLHIPLPWMLGPLFVVGGAGVSGLNIIAVRGGRQCGQLLIGCILGQYFSPDVTRHILSQWWLMLGAAVIALISGQIGGSLLARISGIDRATAYFCSVPGGAAEMAILAERAGARFDRVALAHSLRVLLVVSTVPVLLTVAGVTGSDLYQPQARILIPTGLLALIAIGVVAGCIFTFLRIPNAYILGPLLASGLLTVNQINLSTVPPILGITGQLLIGWALGARFRPDLRHESHRFILGVLASTLVSMILLGASGVLLGHWFGIPEPTMALATAPGGISEMCVTAKILKLGVPLVTAFQVTRLAFLLITALPLLRLVQRFKKKLNH
jgi:membrane AbrB-like protein